MFKTVLTFRPMLFKTIEKVCQDIAAKDKTFGWIKKGKGRIFIYSENEKQAWARGYWFKYRVHKSIHFEIRKCDRP